MLCDLLMAVMNSLETWGAAAGDHRQGTAWRDAVTARMIAAQQYVAYEELVAECAARLGLDQDAPRRLFELWPTMQPWPDAATLARLTVPFGFVTNCSTSLAKVAAGRSGLERAFVLSAEEAGWYKPHPAIYEAACRRLGTRPEQTLFVAGAPYDANGAREAGLRAALLQRRRGQAAPRPGVVVARTLDELVRMFGELVMEIERQR